MVKWRKFAKSLKLRTLMTMVDKDPSKAGAIGALIAEEDMISSTADNAEFPFFSAPGNRNPFWETLNAFAGQQNFFFFASEATVELMKSKNDPRMVKYFQPYPGGDPNSEIVGVPPGGNASPSVHWVLRTATPGTDGTTELVRPAAPDVLFSYQEQLFLEAEAITRGFTTGGDADAKMREGITVAMQSYNVDQADIDTYLAAIPTATVPLIAEEAWIDLIVRPLEGWTHWRRTETGGVGYPNLELPDGAQTGDLMRRFPLPPDEVAANSNAPIERPLDEKMWFDL
jgi:hypothetical protein